MAVNLLIGKKHELKKYNILKLIIILLLLYRAMLMNVGAAEALKSYDYLCFIFHDVDLLPEDDRNLYSCPVQPRHMSVAINK